MQHTRFLQKEEVKVLQHNHDKNLNQKYPNHRPSILRVKRYCRQITALRTGATDGAWELGDGSSAFFTPPSPTTTEALSQQAPMGQSTHTGCQGGCQQAYCPIRRDLGRASVSHALGGLYEGTFEGDEEKNLKDGIRVGPTGASHYLLAKTEPCFLFPSEKCHRLIIVYHNKTRNGYLAWVH